MKNTVFVAVFTFLLGATPVKALELKDSKSDDRLRIELEEVEEQMTQKRFQEYVSELAASAQAEARNKRIERGVDDTKLYKSYNPMVLFTW